MVVEMMSLPTVSFPDLFKASRRGVKATYILPSDEPAEATYFMDTETRSFTTPLQIYPHAPFSAACLFSFSELDRNI
jgi:hypothetical protein